MPAISGGSTDFRADFFRHPKDGDCRAVRFEVPSLSAVSGPARKTTREVASAPAGRAGCRAEQDSERSLSLPNLLLLTSILTLFSFGVATKALILAISSPLCVASSCVLNFAAAVEHNTINSSTCTRDIVCLTKALQLSGWNLCVSPRAGMRGEEKGLA